MRERSDCPYCYGGVLKKGINDVATINPEIASEWHPTKNGTLKPEDVSHSSNKKVWWKGKCGHEWITSVGNRVDNKTGCPFCTGQKLLSGYNDLQTRFPDIATEWHPTKNVNITPDIVYCGSQERYWWRCKLGHEWNVSVSGRTSSNSGCPYCAGRLLAGFNDLQTLHPEIAAEWHPTKNGNLRPTDFKPKSSEIVWWLCRNGHEWKMSIIHRVNTRSICPICKKNKRP